MPFTMVQRNNALVPAGTPVTPELAECKLVIVAVPVITVQVPVPTTGALPASVKLLMLHCAISVPAAAMVTAASLVNNTSSKVEQVPLTIVQRRSAEVPAGTPVTPDVAECRLVMVAVPV